MISNHEGRSVRRKWSFIRRRTDARNAATPTLLVRSAMEAVPAAASAAPLPPLRCLLPPSPPLPPPPPSFDQTPNTKPAGEWRSRRPTQPSSPLSLSRRPFPPFLSIPACLCFRRLLGPNSSHFEENILQRKFKSFCRRPLNQGVSRSFNKLRNYSKTQL